MKHMLWKSLLALVLAGAMQTAQALVTVNTIETPGLTNHDSFESYSTSGAVFTDTEFPSVYEVNFDSPQNYIGMEWSIGEAEGTDGLTFVGFISQYPSFSIEFIHDDGSFSLPLSSVAGPDAGSAVAEDFYTTVRFGVGDVIARYLNTAGNEVIIGQPIHIERFVYGIDTSLMIPEPETYAMLVSGLGVLAWIVRRRKQSMCKAA